MHYDTFFLNKGPHCSRSNIHCRVFQYSLFFFWVVQCNKISFFLPLYRFCCCFFNDDLLLLSSTFISRYSVLPTYPLLHNPHAVSIPSKPASSSLPSLQAGPSEELRNALPNVPMRVVARVAIQGALPMRVVAWAAIQGTFPCGL